MNKENSIREIILGQSIFMSNVNSLISIYKDSESLRNKKIAEIDAVIKESLEQMEKPEDLLGGNLEILTEYDHYQHHFDYLLMQSLYLSMFSLFEHYLNRLAIICENSLGFALKVKDIKGNGDIDTIRKYFHLVCNIDSAKGTTDGWQEILQFKAIRNAIVHQGSVLKQNEKAKLKDLMGYKKLVQHKIWHSDANGYFRLKEISFLEDFQKSTQNYSVAIASEIIKVHYGTSAK